MTPVRTHRLLKVAFCRNDRPSVGASLVAYDQIRSGSGSVVVVSRHNSQSSQTAPIDVWVCGHSFVTHLARCLTINLKQSFN